MTIKYLSLIVFLDFTTSQFLNKQRAHSFLQRNRRPYIRPYLHRIQDQKSVDYYFEESGSNSPNFERECVEEQCSMEEMVESKQSIVNADRRELEIIKFKHKLFDQCGSSFAEDQLYDLKKLF